MRNTSKKRAPTAIDLFSGCGGTSLGLKQAGFSVVAAVEVDAGACEAYRRNHPEVSLIERDIRKVGARPMMRALQLDPGDLTVLAGCPPCQGFSTLRTLRKRAAVPDDRNDLLTDFGRFTRALRPQYVLMENVPSLVAHARFASYLRLLGRLGYEYWYGVLDAADYGVPQRRKRLLLRAALARNPLQSDAAASPRLTVRQAIGGLEHPSVSRDPVHQMVYRHSSRVLRMIEQIPPDGGGRQGLPKDQWLPCHRRSNGFGDVYGRMRWDDVAPTITSGCLNPSKGRFLHPRDHRALSAREAALLQGFPPNYLFPAELGKERVAAMIGNALPPPFIRAHAKGMLSA